MVSTLVKKLISYVKQHPLASVAAGAHSLLTLGLTIATLSVAFGKGAANLQASLNSIDYDLQQHKTATVGDHDHLIMVLSEAEKWKADHDLVVGMAQKIDDMAARLERIEKNLDRRTALAPPIDRIETPDPN